MLIFARCNVLEAKIVIFWSDCEKSTYSFNLLPGISIYLILISLYKLTSSLD